MRTTINSNGFIFHGPATYFTLAGFLGFVSCLYPPHVLPGSVSVCNVCPFWSACLFVNLPVSASLSASVCLSLSVCMLVCLVTLSVCPITLSVCLYVSVCGLSVCLHIFALLMGESIIFTGCLSLHFSLLLYSKQQARSQLIFNSAGYSQYTSMHKT